MTEPDNRESLRPILIVLPNGYADWETPMISAAGADFYGVQVRHATPGGGDVVSMAGLRVTGLPDIAPRSDEIIVLCGGDIWASDNPPEVEGMLRKARDAGHVIAGICAGVTALARAGLLEGTDHTSNGTDFMDSVVPGYAGRERHRDTPRALSDNGIITAPGTAPRSFAEEVLRAAGVPEDQLNQMRALLQAENTA
ncbi:thiamine biosynthesis protein ThiJ [Paracoccus aurantiacus]|uniref:Thiamine biosynthesis protein ThiJ n=1 Tax=Paracoccus aurantiacus TaxID=2599412 RepID=A0A5C6S214_9RHOB|nr:DJ-1/PfpI family protein [Paracoccus aurantiacus]TXB68639.1 thiamine biosynthesis protein ThiJ [Paracoccus aurantiacus]